MSDDPIDQRDGVTIGAEKLFARAAAAECRAHRSLAVAIDDFSLPHNDRLDERTRSTLTLSLQSIVEAIEAEIRDHACQLLVERSEMQLSNLLVAEAGTALDRLWDAGLLRDPELMSELLARVRQEALTAGLPMQAPEDPELPSLINRFVQHADGAVAEAARGVLIGDNRSRTRPDGGRGAPSELPADLHHRVTWWVSAAIRDDVSDPSPALDRALCEAAQRCVNTHDEADRSEITAGRFAAAVNAQGDALAGLLVEALGDRRAVLFTALLGHAARLPYEAARDVVIDPAGDRLWLTLRALELPRAAIAQIGYALCEADPRRNLERFADMLDTIMAIDVAQAQGAIALLRLDPRYRAALRTVRG